MSEVLKIYQNLWNTSLAQFQIEQYELDPLIDSPIDKRRGLTLLSRLTEKISEEIDAFLNEVKRIEPNQYYYPRNDFHLTLLSIITCYEEFLLSAIHQTDYVNIIPPKLN